MFLRRAVVTAGVATAALAATASMAMASPRPAPHQDRAFAAVELLSGGNEQFATVNANAPGRDKGFVDYTNFSVPARSRVWSLNTGASEKLTVWTGGKEYDHTLNAGEVLKALSNNDVNFTGTGFYNPVPSDTWSVAGDIHGRNVTFTITYGPWAVPAYSASFAGHINYNGSANGTFKDVNNTTGTWSLPAGTFRTVLNYVAPIQRDKISVDFRHRTATADLLFRIPFGNQFSGTEVEWFFGLRHGYKFWEQGVNGGALSAETVEAGVIDIQ
jgi:hypothetical protein